MIILKITLSGGNIIKHEYPKHTPANLFRSNAKRDMCDILVVTRMTTFSKSRINYQEEKGDQGHESLKVKDYSFFRSEFTI